MNVFILTDIEGIRDVTDIDFVDRANEKYQLARKYLTETVNLAGRVCVEAGAGEIWCLDGHGGKRDNFFKDEVDPRIRQVSLAEYEDLIRNGRIDCQLEIGAHARAGTVGGFLDHTVNSRKNFSLRVNGREFSELAVHAAFDGAFGVPVVFVSGDETACEQAKEYVPEIFTAPVKRAAERNRCVAYPDAEARLEAGIRSALANYRSIPPMQISLPAVVELTYYRTDFCEEALAKLTPAERLSVERVDARTLRKVVSSITAYGDLKF